MHSESSECLTLEALLRVRNSRQFLFESRKEVRDRTACQPGGTVQGSFALPSAPGMFVRSGVRLVVRKRVLEGLLHSGEIGLWQARRVLLFQWLGWPHVLYPKLVV